MKWLDGRGRLTATLTCALSLSLLPCPIIAQEASGPGSYAADPDTPPYLAPKPKPLRRSYVEPPLAPADTPSPGQTRRAKKPKRVQAAAPAAEQSPAPRLVKQPKPKARPHKASASPAKPAKPVKAPKAAKPAKPAKVAKPPKAARAAQPAPKPKRAAVEAGQPSLRAVQQALSRAGYPAPQDGKLGKSTRRALRNFQRAHRLPVTGQPDRPTLLKLGLN